MVNIQNAFVILAFLISLYFALKGTQGIVLLITVSAVINAPLLKIGGYAIPYHYISLIVLVIAAVVTYKSEGLPFNKHSRSAAYPAMIIVIIGLSVFSTNLVDKIRVISEILLQSLTGSLLRFLFLILITMISCTLPYEELKGLVKGAIVFLGVANLVACVVQLTIGVPELFHSLYFSPSVTPLIAPLLAGRFYRAYGLFPSPVNLGPFSLLVGSLGLAFGNKLLFLMGITIGLFSLSKSAVIGFPLLLLLWFFLRLSGFRNIAYSAKRGSRKMISFLAFICALSGLLLLPGLLREQGFFVDYYLRYITDPFSALSSRYDFGSAGIGFSDLREVILDYPLLGSGYTRLTDEFIGDSTYFVLMKQTGLIGTGVYLLTMSAIMIFFFRKKSLFILIPMISLLSGIGGVFFMSFEHMFFIQTSVLLVEKSRRAPAAALIF